MYRMCFGIPIDQSRLYGVPTRQQHHSFSEISWGGYLTCIVAGLDNRFKAAVPVYGYGFLHENSVWLNQFAKMTPQLTDGQVRAKIKSRIAPISANLNYTTGTVAPVFVV